MAEGEVSNGAEAISDGASKIGSIDFESLLQTKYTPGLNDRTLEDYGRTWQSQNHSVLLIGWGVDEITETKYWILRNSYGKKWGSQGDFKMRRGYNDFGIEAGVIAFDPVLCEPHYWKNPKEKNWQKLYPWFYQSCKPVVPE